MLQLVDAAYIVPSMQMQNLENFSSLPPEEERHFAVFEERMRVAERTSLRVGYGAGAAAFVLLVLIIVAFWGPVEHPGGAKAGETPAAAAKPATSDTSGTTPAAPPAASAPAAPAPAAASAPAAPAASAPAAAPASSK